MSARDFMPNDWFSEPVRLAALAAVCVGLASLESWWPLVRFSGDRRGHYVSNLTLTCLLIVSNVALASLPTAAVVWSTRAGVGICSALGLPGWASLISCLVGLDLGAYWAHRSLHRVGWAWRFHAVHHSEAYVDVTTAFRQHPVETVWRFGFTTLAAAAVGAPLWCLAVYLSASAMNALLEHANVAPPSRLDRWVRLALVTPGMHKVHHSRVKSETNSNYANLFSGWDRVFGTYHPGEAPQSPYGLDGFDDAARQSIAGVLCGPLSVSDH